MKKKPEDVIIARLQWVTQNGFILKANYEWHHVNENFMISQHLIEYAENDEWERLIDSFDYFTNND